MAEITNKVLVGLMGVALTFSFAALFVSVNELHSLGGITGFLTPNATANLTIESTASARFSVSNVDWGSGYVNGTECTLTTMNANNKQCAGFSLVSTPLRLENDGAANLTIRLYADKTAANFIGHADAVFEWNATQGESDSCQNVSSAGVDSTNVNITHFQDMPSSVDTAQVACVNFQYTDANDTMDIDLNVTIPQGASASAKGITIIAIADSYT